MAGAAAARRPARLRGSAAGVADEPARCRSATADDPAAVVRAAASAESPRPAPAPAAAAPTTTTPGDTS